MEDDGLDTSGAELRMAELLKQFPEADYYIKMRRSQLVEFFRHREFEF